MAEFLITDALIYDTGTSEFVPGSVLVRDGVIVKVAAGDGESDAVSAGGVMRLCGKYLLPGLVDVHTHGRSGYDFNTAPAEKYEDIARSYAESGTTAVMPTLASAPLASMEEKVRDISARRSTPGTADFVGVHIEGRYLSPKKRGAHALDFLAPPSSEELKKMKLLSGDGRMRLSIAPELDGAEDMIRTAVSLGVTVSAAHTDGTYAELCESMKWGVTGFTHTFNTMRPLHHREPGGVGAALLCDSAFAEFICDGHHIAPDVIKLSYRAKPHDRFVLVTDSMEAAGCNDGEYSIGGIPVRVKDGIALNQEGALAGSTLDLFTAVKNLMRFCGVSLEDALPFATVNPARMIGAEECVGSIAPGRRADFIVVEHKDVPEISAVIAGGVEV